MACNTIYSRCWLRRGRRENGLMVSTIGCDRASFREYPANLVRYPSLFSVMVQDHKCYRGVTRYYILTLTHQCAAPVSTRGFVREQDVWPS